MTPRERFINAVHGRKVDMVPLDLFGFQHSGPDEVSKISDPLNRSICKRILDRTHFRVHVPSMINRMLVTPIQRIREETVVLPDGKEETHGAIDTPKGPLTYINVWDPDACTSWRKEYVAKDEADLQKIASVPWEPPEGLNPPTGDELSPEQRARGIVESKLVSPVVCVAAMMKYEQFLELCLTNPALITELTRIATERTIECTRVLVSKPGIDMFWIGGSEWLTPPMASPALYDALVQEQERAVISLIHEQSEAGVHVHCHGHVRHALGRMIEREADYTEPVEPPPDGDITMAEAKKFAAGRITLGGNIECRLLCNESEQDISQAVHAAFEGGKERFILRASEGPNPRMSEQEFRNYMRLIDEWETLAPIS